MDANLNIVQDLSLEMSVSQYIDMDMTITEPLVIDMTSNVVQVTGDPWEGPYEIIPHSYDQEFDTVEKLFIDDLTVRAIVTHENPNTKGTTFTIDG